MSLWQGGWLGGWLAGCTEISATVQVINFGSFALCLGKKFTVPSPISFSIHCLLSEKTQFKEAILRITFSALTFHLFIQNL